MNDRNICEICEKKEAHQRFTATSCLLKNEDEDNLAGDVWHNRGLAYVCVECSRELFKIIVEKFNL